MSDSLDDFAGWLLFYYVFNVIAAVLMTIGMVAAAWSIFIGGSLVPVVGHQRALLSASFLSAAAHAGLCFYALAIMKERKPSIPTRLAWITILHLVFSLLAVGVVAAVFSGDISPTLLLPRVIFQSLLAIAWVLYFRVSERVLDYYGANAFKRTEAANDW